MNISAQKAKLLLIGTLLESCFFSTEMAKCSSNGKQLIYVPVMSPCRCWRAIDRPRKSPNRAGSAHCWQVWVGRATKECMNEKAPGDG